MTWAAFFILGAAALATLALGAWAWVWFAVQQDAPAKVSVGGGIGRHVDSPIPGRVRTTSAARVDNRFS